MRHGVGLGQTLLHVSPHVSCPQVLDLLPMADSVVKLTAHCKFCKQVGGWGCWRAAASAHLLENGHSCVASARRANCGLGASVSINSSRLPVFHSTLQEHKHVPALFSLRIAADSRQELVGGADTYAPVCRRHYVQLARLRQPDEQAHGSGSGEAA